MSFEKYLKYKNKYLNLKKSISMLNLKGGAIVDKKSKGSKKVSKKNSKNLSKKGIFVIGIAGASGCGKTYLAGSIKKSLIADGFKGVEIISCDNYNKSSSDGKPRPPSMWDEPTSVDLDLLAKDINKLKNKQKINIPKYNFKTSQRDGIEKELDGSNLEVIIVEGLFVLYDESVRDMLDLKIFTLLDADICLARRIKRDMAERGSTHESVVEHYQKYVKPSYVKYVEPSHKFADIVISTSEYTNTIRTIDVIKAYIKQNLNAYECKRL